MIVPWNEPGRPAPGLPGEVAGGFSFHPFRTRLSSTSCLEGFGFALEHRATSQAAPAHATGAPGRFRLSVPRFSFAPNNILICAD